MACTVCKLYVLRHLDLLALAPMHRGGARCRLRINRMTSCGIVLSGMVPQGSTLVHVPAVVCGMPTAKPPSMSFDQRDWLSMGLQLAYPIDWLVDPPSGADDEVQYHLVGLPIQHVFERPSTMRHDATCRVNDRGLGRAVPSHVVEESVVHRSDFRDGGARAVLARS